MAAEAGDIGVEVAYALPGQQWLLALRVPAGCTAREAVDRSGIAGQIPGLDLEQVSLGVFGTVLDDQGTHVLHEGDRVEIYRALQLDPRESRRARARRSA